MHKLIAISDLHIGGQDSPMLGHPERLTAFLEDLASEKPEPGVTRELVINGDFLDFLAEPSTSAQYSATGTVRTHFDEWTPDEEQAIQKFNRVHGQYKDAFTGLAACIKAVDKFTILLGNHDVELALPRVRGYMFDLLKVSQHHCHFIMNNEAYRLGDVLIEHGNRYDSWNAIDHDGLRRQVSAASRGEKDVPPMAVCPGSKLVANVISPLKKKYPFIDLLKPEDKIVSLIVLVICPQSLYQSIRESRLSHTTGRIPLGIPS